jgi:beta-glucanase (GH16 family)
MIRRFSAACLALALAACTHPAAAPRDTTTSNPPTKWTLVWSDEFDGPAGARIDSTKWNYDLGDGCAAGNCGWGNSEKEWYSDAASSISLTGDGFLKIVARTAPPNMPCYYGPCRYTSAKITTRGKMNAQPGRVEARIKLAPGQGLWPAFWMLGSSFPTVPWPDCGELDIMENHGSNMKSTSSAIHGPGYFGATPFAHGVALDTGSFASSFHTFGVQWDANRIAFTVDSQPHYVVMRSDIEYYGRSILDQPFFVILNLAVGGHFDGDPQSDAIFPATMLVDYVRVYVKDTTP